MPKKLNLERLRSIPILEVAEALGMNVMREGSAWAMRAEDGKASSLTLFPGSNRFKRWSGITHGGVSAGSVIDLVMHIKDFTDVKDAIEWLTDHFPSYAK